MQVRSTCQGADKQIGQFRCYGNHIFPIPGVYRKKIKKRTVLLIR